MQGWVDLLGTFAVSAAFVSGLMAHPRIPMSELALLGSLVMFTLLTWLTLIALRVHVTEREVRALESVK